MKTLSHLVLIAVPLLTFGTASPAQTVYRCANQYSQTPCEDGTPAPVRTNDPRSASEAKAHQATVQKEKRVADSLERQRLKDERQAHQAAVRAAAQEDKAARDAARREADEAARKKKASQPHKIKAYSAPKPASPAK